MDLNVALPFASSLLSFVFAVFLLDQRRERRRPYQLVWTIGMHRLGLGTVLLLARTRFGYAFAPSCPAISGSSPGSST